MSKIDWIGLVASLLQEGAKAWVPGSGIVAGPAGKTAESALDRIRAWREDKFEQKELAADVVAWAHRYQFGDADADLELIDAARMLRQFGADWVDTTEGNLDGAAVADEVWAETGLGSTDPRDAGGEEVHRWFPPSAASQACLTRLADGPGQRLVAG